MPIAMKTDTKKRLLWLLWGLSLCVILVGKLWVTDPMSKFILAFAFIWCLVPIGARMRGGKGLGRTGPSIRNRDSNSDII